MSRQVTYRPPGPGERLLLVMDVDSTFIRQEVIELLAAHAGREAEVAAVTEAAMRGELDFAASLRERVAALAGLPETVFADVLAAVEVTPGARELVAELHRRGHVVALVSGGFVEVVRPLAEPMGIRHVEANALEVRDGVLTGATAGPVVDRAGKARALRRIAAEEDIPLTATVAVGDGANDLDMIAAAGLGVAFAAKPVLAEHADVALPGPSLLDVLPHLQLD
ncbi:MAG: phosphoserine phosphatase SerB [Mobilicoccus sp.]|nr:phosphoserine phosphatase SerB [Mobilicoccus sp.]